MFNTKLFYFGATIALCGGLTSCAVDACSFDSDYKKADPQACMIQTDTDTGIAVSRKRLSRISGGALTIVDKRNPGAEVILTNAGVSLSLGTLNAVGELRRDIAAVELAKIKLGEIALELKGATVQRDSVSIRIYAEPQFTTSQGILAVKQHNVKNDLLNITNIWPEQIDIINSLIFAYSRYEVANLGSRFQKIGTYELGPTGILLSNNNYPIGTEMPTGGSDDSLVPGFSFGNNQLILAFASGANHNTAIQVFGISPFSTGTVSARTTWSTITSFSSDPSGRYAGAIINGKLQLFNDQYLTSSVAIDDLGSNKESLGIARYGIGDIDGDGASDLAVWHKTTNTVSVYKNQRVKFVWDSALSNKLQARTKAALKGLVPTAVRLADIDRDGVDDVIVADGKRLLIFPNDGNGDYEETIEIQAVGSGADALGAISAIAVGKLGANVNAGPSLALVSRETKKIAVVLNQSTE